MNTARLFLFVGAISGFLTVALGAFAAHGLKNLLAANMLVTFQTGVDYQGLHALALLVVGILSRHADTASLHVAGWGFIVGILLFSGSLYLLTLTDTPWLGMITPFGGTAFLVGWAALAWHAVRA